MTLAIVYSFTVVLFLALMFSLSLQPKVLTKLNGYILIITGILGILFYGYGYSVLYESVLQSAIRTLFSVFCMFLGRNEIGASSAAPKLQVPILQFLIYLTHLMALYCTASAVIATLGTRLVRTLRLLLFRRRDLNLIFGANPESIAFGTQLQKEKKGEIIFADPGNGSSYDPDIIKMGSLLFTDADAKQPAAAFLKKIGVLPGGRRLNVFCLDTDEAANLAYARNMGDMLKTEGYAPEQVSLSAILTEESTGADLLERGFGSVIAVEKPDMLARLMIHNCPPYSTVSFDESGRAADDFECLIIGFGLTGQAALRQLIANGQFEGSTFHATIVASDYNTKSGSFFYRYPGLKAHDWFTVIEDNARSVAFYSYLENNCPSLNYVAICTGNDKENAEIAYELRSFLLTRGLDPAVMLISETGISRLSDSGMAVVDELYSPDILLSTRLDTMAMVINHQYHLAEGHTPAEDWAACDYFSRLSCRASADFTDAFLKAAGTDRETVLKDGWELSPEVLENLGRTEHLRWCAFHETMGYRAMPEAVFAARAAQFEKEKAETGKGKIRIGKDTGRRLHACLIPWEDLDDLASREEAVTGRSVDYKEIDCDNVRMIPDMLKAAEAIS